jgi:hypothetical protein
MGGHGGAAWSQLGISEGSLCCSSGEGEGTNRGGGFSSSSWGPSIIGKTVERSRSRWARVPYFEIEISADEAPFYRGFNLKS